VLQQQISERGVSSLDREMQWRVAFDVGAVDVGAVEKQKFARHQRTLWKIDQKQSKA
jgi:hypothetical protein